MISTHKTLKTTQFNKNIPWNKEHSHKKNDTNKQTHTHNNPNAYIKKQPQILLNNIIHITEEKLKPRQ